MKKTWTIKWKTKNGIRESLLATGFVCGTREWKLEYHRRWMAMFPETRNEYFRKYYSSHSKQIAARRKILKARKRERSSALLTSGL